MHIKASAVSTVLFLVVLIAFSSSLFAQGEASTIYLPAIFGQSDPSATSPEPANKTPSPTSTLPPGVTPSPTSTLPPDVTSSPTPPLPPGTILPPELTPVPTLPPGATITPTPTTPSGVTPSPVPTLPPTPTPTPTTTRIISDECEQFGRGLARSSYFGVQMYGNTRPENRYFEALTDSKAGWVRAVAPWAPTEPTNREPDEYDWTQIDRELAAAAHLNLEMIGMVGQAPGWAAPVPEGAMSQASLREFAQFVGALVERYDADGVDDAPCSPMVRHWEFYNEPDNYYTWGTVPERYAQMLAAVYPAVKAASPYAQVIFGGVAQDWFVDQNGFFVRDWVDDVMAAGAGPYFDIMNVHNYPNYYPEWGANFPGTWEKVQAFRQILANYGYVKPIMVTETGDHAAELNDYLNHRQSIVLFQVLTQARAADVAAVTWFTLHDLPTYPEYTGLVTSDTPPVRKPGFDAFTTIVDLLEDARFTRIWGPATDGGTGYIGYEFDDPVQNRRLVIAWTFWDAPTNVETTISFDAAQAFQISLYGAITPLVDGSDGVIDGKITVTVDKEPIVIDLPRQ